MVPSNMSSWIRDLFRRSDAAAATDVPPPQDDLKLAAAALMMEAARLDDTVDDAERDRIAELIQWRFGLTEADAAALIRQAETVTDGPAHWHGLTAVLRDRLNEEERIQIVEMLWDVVYADGHLHHLEASLLRRATSLLNVSDKQSGAARQRAMRRHGLTDDGPSGNSRP